MRNLARLPGIYFIRDASTKEVLYVGRSVSCVKHALLRHFRAWGADSRWHAHHRQVFDRTKVEVKVYVLREAAWAAATEAELIARAWPRENRRAEQAALVAREPGEDVEEAAAMSGEDDGDVPF